MRAESVREQEKNVPVSKAEDARIQKAHRYRVVYANPRLHSVRRKVLRFPGAMHRMKGLQRNETRGNTIAQS